MSAWVPQSSGRGSGVEAGEFFESSLAGARQHASRRHRPWGAVGNWRRGTERHHPEAFGVARARSGTQAPKWRSGWKGAYAKHDLSSFRKARPFPPPSRGNAERSGLAVPCMGTGGDHWRRNARRCLRWRAGRAALLARGQARGGTISFVPIGRPRAIHARWSGRSAMQPSVGQPDRRQRCTKIAEPDPGLASGQFQSVSNTRS